MAQVQPKKQDATKQTQTTQQPVTKPQEGKSVDFKHGIYGLVVIGPNKGYEAEIREFYPVKYEVEVSTTRTVFYKDDLKLGDKIENCKIVQKQGKNKYVVECTKTILFSHDYVLIKGQDVLIKKGDFKGSKGKLIKIKSPRVKIYIDTGVRKITDIVKVSNMFYKDLILKNGNQFSVRSVETAKDGKYKINGIERTEKGGKVEFAKKIITSDDISEQLTGFSFKSATDTTKSDEDDQIMFSPVDYRPEHEDDEDEDDTEMLSEDSEEDEGEEDQDSEQSESDSERYKMAYNVMGRVSFRKDLPLVYKTYDKLARSILKFIGESDDEVDFISIYEDTERVLNKFESLLKGAKINFNIKESATDIKLIVAIVVLLEITKRGYTNTLDEYIDILLQNDYFFKKVSDINSVLLTQDKIFECKISAVGDKESTKIVHKLMECYNGHVQKVLGTYIKFGTGESKPLELKQIISKKQVERRFITVKDIVTDSIPEDGTNVLWGDKYTHIINDLKSKLKAKIDKYNVEKLTAITKRSKALYEYIYENIDRFPVVLKSLKEQMLKMLKEKKEEYHEVCGDNECLYAALKNHAKDPQVDLFIKMSSIVDKLKVDLKKAYDKFEKLKSKKIESIQKQREKVEKKREKISVKRKIEEAIEDIGNISLSDKKRK